MKYLSTESRTCDLLISHHQTREVILRSRAIWIDPVAIILFVTKHLCYYIFVTIFFVTIYIMSSTKSTAIDIFTCQENQDYLKTMIPNKELTDDEIQSMINAFSKNYIAYTSNTQETWGIVRHMNRLFLQDSDFFPSTRTTFGAFGETVFMAEEIGNPLNDYPTCGQGANNFGGIPWSGSYEGGYLNGGCPPNDLKPCDSDNRFTSYGNKMARRNKGNWGKPVGACTNMYH
jgi:hypothetical protein